MKNRFGLMYVGVLSWLGVTSFQLFGTSKVSQITVRDFYKTSCNAFYTSAVVRTFLPIPVLSTIVQAPPKWIKYRSCRTMYRYFKSAYVLVEKKDATPKQIKKAKKRLTSFLEDIQSEAREKEDVVNPFLENKETQQVLNQKIYAWTIDDLAALLNRADKVFPESLGDSHVGLVRYDRVNFIFSIRTVDRFESGQSIFEADIEKKRRTFERKK